MSSNRGGWSSRGPQPFPSPTKHCFGVVDGIHHMEVFLVWLSVHWLASPCSLTTTHTLSDLLYTLLTPPPRSSSGERTPILFRQFTSSWREFGDRKRYGSDLFLCLYLPVVIASPGPWLLPSIALAPDGRPLLSRWAHPGAPVTFISLVPSGLKVVLASLPPADASLGVPQHPLLFPKFCWLSKYLFLPCVFIWTIWGEFYFLLRPWSHRGYP